jgi:hypothetical protein
MADAPVPFRESRRMTFEEARRNYTGAERRHSDITHSITHAEFVAGLRDRTVNFTYRNGEAIGAVGGLRKTVFTVVVAPCLVLPIIAAGRSPAYHEDAALLLLGVFVAGLIASTFGRRKSFSIGGAFIFACLVVWFARGREQDYTFLALCSVWGYVYFKIADLAQWWYATRVIIRNPDVFARAVDHNRILVARRKNAPQQSGMRLA